ncbi:MAG: PilZ domain-containing protein [Pseudomonadota bacterium]
MNDAQLATARLRINPRLKRDHRRHRRVPLILNGRFLNALSEEHTLVTLDISAGGANVRAKALPEIGSSVVCYVDELGRLAGRVSRHTEDGFAIAFVSSQPKRDRLADKLIWLYNRDKLGLTDERGAARHAADGPAVVVRQDGRRLQCRVVDISLTGAGFETDGPAPMIGERIMTGSLSGEVVRRSKNSFGVRFLRPATLVKTAAAAAEAIKVDPSQER